ncbi:DNA translocase FtsK [Rhodobacteraceae bacterium THAF1]|uniref:DNA translocase FtsK n=1 Tax=Palleronia sp. THAF1 TaxID=2587842 RepID=UPI000F40A157|nr:DNA translocase FtsK [Palleronia sp. THAF1]QFU09913.1 DNA translocase FtsK [Palleronia sp. THAF1]VDC17184.1 DNA translocase FtsK [Rhodobacteraceae bacterium THAF1]
MAYQTRGRDPLFDSDTQAILERRGKELFGIALIGAGLVLALMLGTYVPGDPSWLTATTDPARNIFGRMGASVAGPAIIIAGLASWGVVASFMVWGGRFLFHMGAERAVSRAVFVPIGVALLAIYLSTHTPGAGWEQSFGLGGLFGDTALGTLFGLFGVDGAFGLKMTALFIMVLTVAVGGFVLGFTKHEVKTIVNWLLAGTIFTYAGIVAVLGLGQRGVARGVSSGARLAAERLEAARVARAERSLSPEPEMPAMPKRPVLRATPIPAPEPDWDEIEDAYEYEEPQGFLSRLGDKLGLTAQDEPEYLPEVDMPDQYASGERIKGKISDAIRSRARAQPMLTAGPRIEPQVKRRHPKGPQPIILPKAPVMADTAIEEDEVFEAEPMTAAPVEYDAQSAPAFAPQVVREAPKPKVQHVQKKPLRPSTRAKEEAQPSLSFEDRHSDYEHPPLNLLADPSGVERHVLSDEALEENARMLETVLDDYGVKGEIVSVRPGPVVTMYELEPAPGLKASRVIGLSDDIARSMSALSARVSTVPGRSVIGIELPNEKREMCVLREILSDRDFGDGNHQLPLALGKDIGGDPVIANLAKMPHLLIAGTTGSGKSVAINTMILSLLYKLTPEECRMIMIDPKMLELSVYDGIPHLLSPVVTDPKKAVVALKWVVGEMEDRYRKMSKMGVRNIDGFNGRVKDALAKGELFERTVQTGFDEDTGEPIFETEETVPEILPYIVVVVDEMADLMMVAGKEIEACIQRLAQMARASGIHLIMATQRPSVDVITGTIKANFPTRISFSVTSKIDSRTILGEQGAEQLLGMGDMLYMAGGSKITRVHGPFCSDEEVEEIVTYLKSFGPPDYKSGVVEGPEDGKESDIDAVLGLGGNTNGEDAQYDEAVQIVARDRKCSTSYIQRKLGIGYNKAAKLVEQMEEEGVVSSANHVGKREVLVPEVQ